jgi:hypothetical protein
MEQSARAASDILIFLVLLWNPKVHYRVEMSWPPAIYWRSFLILSFHLRLSSECYAHFRQSNQNFTRFSLFLHARWMCRPFQPRFDDRTHTHTHTHTYISRRVQNMEFLFTQLCPNLCQFIPLRYRYTPKYIHCANLDLNNTTNFANQLNRLNLLRNQLTHGGAKSCAVAERFSAFTEFKS